MSKDNSVTNEQRTRPTQPLSKIDELKLARPKRCRVKLNDKMQIEGAAAFDAEFDWDQMAAFGLIEGQLVCVGVQSAAIRFYGK